MSTITIQRDLRCAIYTRKSLEDRWDQEFNSIESQRDICAAYIKCQQHRHWSRLPQSYDDAGHSGASLHRPALQQLLRDVERHEVDVVVIYKIDRFTRSLADFIRLIEVLDSYQVKFVSVTQAFDTSDSLGRLVLNILLTFAQFERELIADRIRDKVAAIKRRGKINGGRAPLGYDIVDRRLIVNPIEAELVRSMFRRYLEVGSCSALTRQLKVEGVRSKVWISRTGEVRGGRPATNGMLYHVLQNPVYVGRVPHNGDSYPGEHQATIDEVTWEAVQALIEHRRKFGPDRRRPLNLLSRLLRDSHGRRMEATTSGKRQLRYYQSARTPWAEQEGIKRYLIRAEHLEELVVGAVKAALGDRETVRAALRAIGRRGDDLNLLPRRMTAACSNFENVKPDRVREILRALIVECEVSPNRLIIVFRTIEVARFVGWDGIGLFEADRAGWTANDPTFTVRRALDEVRFGRALDVPVEPIAMERRREPCRELVNLIQTARCAQAAVDAESELDVKVLAGRFKCSPQRFCRLLRLNYLAPDIVAAVRVGAQPADLTLARLVRGPLPLDWDLQRSIFGFPSRPDHSTRAKPSENSERSNSSLPIVVDAFATI